MADDIKKDADSQRAKQAPQPREKGDSGSLSSVIDAVKKGNEEQTRTTEAATGLVANMVNIANSVERVGLAGNAAIDTLANNLSGNKLKELETAKENEKRDDRTNELLEELVDNTDTGLLESPKGFFGTALAVLGGLTGALAGLIGGFALGVLESIKLMGKGFKNLGGRIFTFIDDLFGKNISKGLNTLKGGFQSRFITPVDDFFKNINRAFKAGFRGEKIFTRVNGRFGKLGFFGTIGTKLGKAFRSLSKGVDFAKGLKATVTTFFGSIGTRVSGLFKNFKLPMGLGDDIDKAGKSMRSIGTFVRDTIRPFTKTTEQADKLKDIVMLIVRPFKAFKEFFSFFAAKFKPLGKVLGKLFLPITIIMGIFDGIKGAISGAEEESGTAGKFVGGLMGAISGILVGLVGMPLDLLKDLVSWIAGKMGMDGASEFLDSFSFSDIISGVFDVVKDFFMAIVDFFTDLFSEGPSAAFGNLGTNINELFKKILRGILPDPSVEREWYNPIGFIQRAIPDGLYEYAGMDPKTGEIDAQYKEAIDAEVKKTGDDLNNASIENESNKSKSDGLTANTAVDNSTKSSSNQTINIMGPSLGLATANELRFQG
jgi:hypothetical protein